MDKQSLPSIEKQSTTIEEDYQNSIQDQASSIDSEVETQQSQQEKQQIDVLALDQSVKCIESTLLLMSKPQKLIIESEDDKLQNKFSYQDQLKVKYIFNDPKIVQAMKILLKKEISCIMKPNPGYIRIQSDNCLYVYYKEENHLLQAEQKLDQLITQLELINLDFKVAESGMLKSATLRKKFLQQKIAYFEDKNQNFLEKSYYLCGLMSRQKLHAKMNEMSHFRFAWFNLYSFHRSRSNRAIMRNILKCPIFKQYITKSFKNSTIEVISSHNQPKIIDGVTILLTFYRSKPNLNHNSVSQQICKQIQSNYIVLCFSFAEKGLNLRQKTNKQYLVQVRQNFQLRWFIIRERNAKISIFYIFFISRKQIGKEIKPEMTKIIEGLRVKIFGRRFFKGFQPTKQKIMENQLKKYKIFPFPSRKPYSWTYKAAQGTNFDWQSTLDL